MAVMAVERVSAVICDIFRTPSSWTSSARFAATFLSPRWPTVVGRRGLPCCAAVFLDSILTETSLSLSRPHHHHQPSSSRRCSRRAVLMAEVHAQQARLTKLQIQIQEKEVQLQSLQAGTLQERNESRMASGAAAFQIPPRAGRCGLDGAAAAMDMIRTRTLSVHRGADGDGQSREDRGRSWAAAEAMDTAHGAADGSRREARGPKQQRSPRRTWSRGSQRRRQRKGRVWWTCSRPGIRGSAGGRLKTLARHLNCHSQPHFVEKQPPVFGTALARSYVGRQRDKCIDFWKPTQRRSLAMALAVPTSAGVVLGTSAGAVRRRGRPGVCRRMVAVALWQQSVAGCAGAETSPWSPSACGTPKAFHFVRTVFICFQCSCVFSHFISFLFHARSLLGLSC